MGFILAHGVSSVEVDVNHHVHDILSTGGKILSAIHPNNELNVTSMSVLVG